MLDRLEKIVAKLLPTHRGHHWDYGAYNETHWWGCATGSRLEVHLDEPAPTDRTPIAPEFQAMMERVCEDSAAIVALRNLVPLLLAELRAGRVAQRDISDSFEAYDQAMVAHRAAIAATDAALTKVVGRE